MHFKPPAKSRPSRIALIAPASFADDWPSIPKAPIAVGLRLLSERDFEVAMAVAAQATTEMLSAKGSDRPVDRTTESEFYTARLLCEAVSRAVCDPNDTAKTHEAFPATEDSLPMALSPTGIEALYRELEQLHIERSPTAPSAIDDDLRLLRAHLRAGSLRRLPQGEQSGARRFLALVLQAFARVAPEVHAEDFQDDDGEDGQIEGGDEPEPYRVVRHVHEDSR